MKKLIALIITTFLVWSCSSVKNTPATDTSKSNQSKEVQKDVNSTPENLNMVKWTLAGMKGMNFSSINYYDGAPWITFDVEKLSVTGNSGCNSFGGDFTIEGTSIKMGRLMSTKKFCNEIPETEFFQYLESTDSYNIQNNFMNILSEGKVVLTFIKSAE